MNFKNIYDEGNFNVNESTANNNPAVHPAMNITITPQLTTSKVMITVNILGEWDRSPYNSLAYLRRTVNNVETDILPHVNVIKNKGLVIF